MTHNVKLGEEYWELCEKILWFLGIQRKEKIKDWIKKQEIWEEIADIIFVALILGKSLDIDMHKVISNKMAEIKNRNL